MKKEFQSHFERRPQAQSTSPLPQGKPLAKTIATTDPNKKQDAVARKRFVRYKIICAPLNPPYVTDSASHLDGLPYAIADAADGKVFYPNPKLKPSFKKLLGKFISMTEPVEVPDAVSDVVIFLGNDAYKTRRKVKLFKVTPAETGITLVTIYETYTNDARINKLKAGAKTAVSYPDAPAAQTVKSTNDQSFVGYLTGDVWAEFSYQYTTADITRLLKASMLERTFVADAGRGVAPEPISQAPNSQRRSVIDERELQTVAIDNTFVARPRISEELLRRTGNRSTAVSQVPQSPSQSAVTLKSGDKEKLNITIEQWVTILSPVYTSLPVGIDGPRAEGGGIFHLPLVNIRLKYDTASFRNAIKTSDNTTVQQILQRTSPLAYKAVIESAWIAGVDEVKISSTWRPMLGSNQHRMGVALDVLYVDDLDDKKQPFSVNISSGKTPASLYRTFQTNLDADESITLLKDPWKNTDKNHKNHLHLKAADPDEE